MSITFYLREGERYFLPDFDSELCINLASENGRELLEWLGVKTNQELAGEHELGDFTARCRRRLWPIERNEDPAKEAATTQKPGCARWIYPGRRAGYLRERTQTLLAFCEHGLKEGFTHIYWA